jgi:hypothetical protein
VKKTSTDKNLSSFSASFVRMGYIQTEIPGREGKEASASAPKPSGEVRTMKAVKIGAVALISLMVLVFAGGPMLVEWYVFRDKPSELKSMYHDFKSRELTFPADALDIQPASAETQAAATAFREVWDKDNKLATKVAKLCQGDLVANAAKLDPAARADLAQLVPLLAAWRRLVDRPDYTINVLATAPLDETQTSLAVPNFLMLQTVCKLAALQAVVDGSEGRPAEALDGAESVLKAARAHPYDLLITQLIAIAIRSIGATAEQAVVAACNDPALLRRALDQQKRELDAIRTMPNQKSLMPCERVGMMRLAKQQGIDVPDLTPMTERKLASLANGVQADYLEKVVLPKVQNDSQKAQLVRRQIASYRNMAALSGGPVTSFKDSLSKLAGHFAEPILFIVGVPNFMEAPTREQTAIVRLELLRLETARKLAAIERGTPPADLAALTPAYLDKSLADRFAKNDAPYSLAGDKIYSIGPDGKDQQASISYDPTNGTTSAGDIFFKPVPTAATPLAEKR